MPYSPGILDQFEEDVTKSINDFNDPRQEWRRLIAEFIATFFLVTVAAGVGMVAAAYPGSISPAMKGAAIGLVIMVMILFVGKISGTHMNPAITLAFAARGDFPWRRVPGYIIVQIAAGFLAAFIPIALPEPSWGSSSRSSSEPSFRTKGSSTSLAPCFSWPPSSSWCKAGPTGSTPLRSPRPLSCSKVPDRPWTR